MNFTVRLSPILYYMSIMITGSILMIYPITQDIAQAQVLSSKGKSNKNAKDHIPTQSNAPPNQDMQNPNDNDKNPTQLLFEAINTGNLRQAQEALDRGADLHASNVLGQTPLEMSVDLNRNRITFLLLSMRGYNNSPQSLSKNSNEANIISVKNQNGHLSIKSKNKNTLISSTPIHRTIEDKGHPNPEIGFLGFK